MARLTVRLFGRFDALYTSSPSCPAQPLAGLDARKLQEFFSFLLLHRDHVFPREVLAELVAPELGVEQSRKGLRQALWQLQTALNPELADKCPDEPLAEGDARPLMVDVEWVSVNPRCDLWLDVAELETAFQQVMGQAGESLCAESAERLTAAVELYRGDLLEGWYQDWCLVERERLQSAYLALLDKLMGYSAAHREYERGIAYGQIILRHDRARERAHQRLMSLRWLAGDRTGALRQYRACVAALREELGVGPGRRTLQLYEQIAADSGPGENRMAAGPPTWRQLPAEQRPDQADPLLEIKTSFTTLLQLQAQVNRRVAELGRLLDVETL